MSSDPAVLPPDTNPDLTARLVEGVRRLAAVLRADEWAATEAIGLTPTQAGILGFAARRGPVRLQEAARQLRIGLPTASNAVDALERKGLILRDRAPGDGRAVALRPTPAGLSTLEAVEGHPKAVGAAVASLSAEDRAALLVLVVRLIRALQQAGAVPVQRLCVTCRHFRPNAHPGDLAAPHHCAFVDAAIGHTDLRVDCDEHEAADPAVQAAIWTAFDQGSAVTLRATPTA